MSSRPRKRGRRGGAPQAEAVVPSITREELATKTVTELRQMAAELELDVKALKKKDEIIEVVYEAKVKAEGFIDIMGVLDVLPEGYGFIRTNGYLPGDRDVYCSMSQVRRFELRRGDLVKGQVRPPKETEKYSALLKVSSINGLEPEAAKQRKNFKDLTPVYPDDRLRLEHGAQFMTTRVIDLVAPIGKGQRGLIVSPPKAGKTTVLKDIAAAITANNPEVYLMCLLVDERPEEVTDMERSIHGEVVSSTFDMPSENHIAVAELVMERAKRMVESGYDVVILLDSITRLARAYNLATPASGRILSGGVDSTALYPPKKFFGAARNIEFGGSLTILATALVDTGSKMDEVIFEEFKGTGNMELRLDRGMADRRIFPAIDVVTSGTRKEELILDPMEAPFVWGLRRILHGVDSSERALDMLIKGLKQTPSNQEFLTKMAKRADDKRVNNGIEL
ncbi:MAG: transcription termination factor [Actinobacteria bacterium]|nr:MAG: transcription termination factor [Actinomycetota bacterium]